MKRLFVFFSFFLISCENNVTDIFASSELEDNFLENYYSSYRDHPAKINTLAQVKNFYDENEVCDDVQACSEICKKLYQYDFDQKDCKQLPAPLVHRFNSIYESFQNKDFEKPHRFDTSDLKFFLSFSLEPSVRVFSQLGSSSAKSFLTRLAFEWDVAQVFLQEDLDFILLKTLLNEIANDPIRALGEFMENGMSFQEIALIKQNDSAFSFEHNFLKNLCEDNNECIVKHYCSLSKSYNKDTLDELNKIEDLKKSFKDAS